MYAIVTDVMGDRMYLAWQSNTWDDGYFWTSKETFDECIKQGWNTKEHRFAFRSYYQAIGTLFNIDIPKSWEAHVVQI